MKRKLFQKDIAVALGISAPMVTRYKQAGMPTNSIAAARRWRESYLDPIRMMAASHYAPEKIAEPPATTSTSTLNLVHRLVALAEKDFDHWQPDLRAALRLVPEASRDDVLMPIELWERLICHVSMAIEAWAAAEGTSAWLGPDDPEVDEKYTADFWYAVAIGDIRINENYRAAEGATAHAPANVTEH